MGCRFFVTLTFQWKWLERQPPLHIVNCLPVQIEDRGKWILQGSLSETSLWCTFSADFACITNFTIWEKNSHIKLPPFFIKSIICFVESLSESWCCLIICIMSFPSSAHVQKGEGALWWEGKPHQTQQTTAHHNSQCPPPAGTLVEIFKKKCQSVKNIFRLILPWRRTRWSTSTSGSWTRTWRSLNRRWRWDQDQVSRRLPSPLCLFRTRDGCRRARARRRRWSTRRRWRTRRRRESRRRTTRRRRRQRRWEGGGKRKDFAMFFPQVENLTTPLISYVGSGVPQEVLDMPVDPNEPTYCVCQQVSNYMWRILHLFWCYISWSLFNSLLYFALSFIELFNCRFLTVRWLVATTRIVPSSGSTSAAWTWPTSRRASGIAPSVCPCSRRRAGSPPHASSNCDHAAKGRNLKVLAAIIYDVKSEGL